MSHIPRTWISTNSKREVPEDYDLLLGVDKRATTARNHTTHKNLLDKSKSVGVAKARARLGLKFFTGLSGPGWSTAFFAEGNFDDHSIDLTLWGGDVLPAGSITRAGLYMSAGADIDLRLNFSYVEYTYPTVHCSHWSCHTHWHTKWGHVNVPANLRVDFGELLVAAIHHHGEKGVGQILNNGKGAKLHGKALDFTSAPAQRADLHHKGKAELKIHQSWLLDISHEPAWKPVKKFFNEFGGDLHLGPTIGFTVKPTLAIAAIHTDGKRYDDLHFSGSARSGKVKGTHSGASSEPAGRLGFEFENSVGFSFTLGFRFSISVAKLFKVHASPHFNFLDLLGIHLPRGHWKDRISGKYHHDGAPAATVVLDPPGFA